MIFIYGDRLFGRCDEIEGVGHVVTRFTHIYYFPLVPMGSSFVYHDRRSTNPAGFCCCGYGCCGDRGCAWVLAPVLPLSCKSIGMAYLQATAVVAGMVLLVTGAVQLSAATDQNPYRQRHQGRHDLVIAIILTIAGPLCILTSCLVQRFFRHATLERAREIAEQIGRRDLLPRIDSIYGGKANVQKVRRRRRRRKEQGCQYGDVSLSNADDDDETEVDTFQDEEETGLPLVADIPETDTNTSNVEMTEAKQADVCLK
ncbi:expressed unknown protein [Seminavis robusta]|uniref:Uncharacterized protein n=1 Tax=Seminavis robusta TaxID=568900 RepID=A0A9N8DFD3_9STRA|nr:expressed unknown protein [Seminavis robusta]|eukprot:Sro114_g056470.1 n/a (257) ;mRNA; r:81922-82692